MTTLGEAWASKKDTYTQPQHMQQPPLVPEQQPVFLAPPQSDMGYNASWIQEATQQSSERQIQEQAQRTQEITELDKKREQREFQRDNRVLGVVDQLVTQSHQQLTKKLETVAHNVQVLPQPTSKRDIYTVSLVLGFLICLVGGLMVYSVVYHHKNMNKLAALIKLTARSRLQVEELAKLM
jgi:Flp pilus assembly protein TadB